MKINKMNISQFGCINKKDINFGDGISILKGNNESGKSTTHQAILALIFGYKNFGTKKRFALSSKAKSFKGGYPTLEGKYVDKLGEHNISRYFDGNDPKLSISRGGIITKADNLSVVKGMARDTYEGIYSLDIDQIVKLKESWEREQSSILSGLMPNFLLPSDVIMDNLDKKIKDAWKGKTATKLTKAKEIEDEISQLKTKMQQAKKDQVDLRLLEIEEEEILEKIIDCDKNIKHLAKKEIELRRQKEFYKEYSEINNILVEHSEAQQYEDVPKDLHHYLQGLIDSAISGKKKSDEIAKKIENLNDIVGKYKAQSKDIDYYKEIVPKAQTIVNNLTAVKNRLVRASDMERDKKNKIVERIKRLFTNKFTWNSFNDVMDISIAECLALWDSIDKVDREKAEISQILLRNRVPMSKGQFKNFGRIEILLILATVIGALMIFMPLGIDRIVTVVLGALIFLSSVAGLFFKGLKGNVVEDNNHTIVLRRLESEHTRLIQNLKKMLDFDFIPAEKRNNPDKSLIESIAQMQEDYSEYIKLQVDVEKDKNETSKSEEVIKKIAMEVLGRSSDCELDMRQMHEKVNDLINLEKDAKISQRAITVHDEQLLDIKNSVFADEKQMEDIRNRLYNLEGNSITEKADTLMDMRYRYSAALSRQNVLKQKYTEYYEHVNQIDKSLEEKIYDLDSEFHKTVEKLDELREKQKELSTKKGELSQNMRQLKRDGLTPAIIDGKLKDLREERDRRIRLRDEYAICYAIIQKARDKFVSEYSPDFLAMAGEYLSLITDGGYTKIQLSENGKSIMVVDASSRIYDFDGIDKIMSRGTREQIYFALRLAMLNRFDPDGEKLPIILDEALVNWDVIRFKKLMKIVHDIAKERQVFMFTCHDYVTDIVAKTNNDFALIDI